MISIIYKILTNKHTNIQINIQNMISIIYKILTNNPPEGGNWELWIQLRRNRIHLE